MQNWIKVTLLLCAFGTLREIRPSEPYVSEFLTGPWWNITQNQLNQEVYPIGTYSYLALLLVVFLVTDFLRFKPVILLSGISGIGLYAILLWTKTIEWVKVTQFVYGLYMATEVAYLTYIYAQVDSDKYPKVSSYTRIAALAGRFLSGVSSQLLVQLNLMDLRELYYITFTAQILATFWAIWLPPVQYGIYFHRRNSLTISTELNEHSKQAECVDKRPIQSNVTEAFTLIGRHARLAYRRPHVVVWSLLYAAALALYVQAQTYVQLLWVDVQEGDEHTVSYNGLVEALLTLLGAGASYLSSVCGPGASPAAAAAAQGLALFFGTHYRNIYLAYVGYIIAGVLFHYVITLASSKIASQLRDESCFGLIFGINTFLGTGLQSLLTYIMITKMELSIVSQYYVISGLYGILASLWSVGWIVDSLKHRKSIRVT